MLYYGYEISKEDDGSFSVAVGGWIYSCKTIEDAKKQVRDCT
jgi:hypothetical protein